MQSTFNQKESFLWLDKQEELKGSLISKPLIVVYRPKPEDFALKNSQRSIFNYLEKLQESGVNHIEIAWSNHPNWKLLMLEAQRFFPKLLLGAASINTIEALKIVSEINLSYSMSPFWDQDLQEIAKEQNQILIPGAFTPSEIHRASKFGHRLVKLFPAISLGINYLSQIEAPLAELPFMIAAGGLKASDIKPWLTKGYGAIVIGRELIKEGSLNKDLENWLITNKQIKHN